MKVDIRIDERYENKSHPVFDYLKYTLGDQKLDGGISVYFPRGNSYVAGS